MIRAALHVHSLWSYDGHWSLSRLARLFGALGYDAVLMTEHDTGFDPDRFGAYRDACAAASTRRCAVVPGIEYSSPDNAVHILTWGLDRFLAEHRPVAETLAAVADRGGAAILAHPIRQEAYRRYDPAWRQHLHGIELWNRKSDGLAPGTAAQELIRTTGLPATVGVDFHRWRNLWPLAMRFPGVGRGPGLEARLVTALRAGAHDPEALWRPLFDRAGRSRAVHGRLEGLRRGALAGLQRKR